MPEPIVLDVRNGMTLEAIEGLRQARRVQLGLKDAETAVLGLWASEEAVEPLTGLVIRAVPFYQSRPEGKAPVVDMPGPAAGGPLERIAAALRPGDQLTLNGRPIGMLYLHHTAGKSFSASYRVTIRYSLWGRNQPY